jgi:hypothetical protein
MDAPKTKSFWHRAACLSWVCPIVTVIIFVFLVFERQIVPRKVIALVASGALGLVVIGLMFGIVALFGISKHGTKSILAPAIIGVIINGLLLSFVIANSITARVRAIRQHSGTNALPVVAMRSNNAESNARYAGLFCAAGFGLAEISSGGVLRASPDTRLNQRC